MKRVVLYSSDNEHTVSMTRTKMSLTSITWSEKTRYKRRGPVNPFYVKIKQAKFMNSTRMGLT